MNVIFADQEGPGAVWTAETEDRGGGSGPQWFRKNHSLANPQAGAPQTQQGGQKVHHEPQGHAQDTGTV